MCHTHLIVDGDAIGPANTDVHQHSSVRSIQTRSLYAWILSPLRPKQIPAHTATHEECAASVTQQKCTIKDRKSGILRSHPFSGCTVMARGLSNPWETTTYRNEPFNLATSITSKPWSVQQMFPAAQRGTRQGFTDQFCNKALNAPESGKCVCARELPAIQSTAMPSTRPIPLVMMSSLHV